MTIQSNVNDGITYSGNDSATTFAFPFKVDLNTQIEVIIRDALGVETTAVLNTDYTVAGFTVEGSGVVTYPISGDPLATGKKITIKPKMDFLQSTDIRNQGRFAPEIHENAFDTLMMHIKELKGEINRTIQFKKSSEITGAEFGVDPEDGKVVAWDGVTGKTKNVVAVDSALVTTFWETILANTNLADSITDLGGATAFRAAIGAIIGTDVQAYHANLAAVAGLVGATDKVPYFSSASTLGLSNLPSGRNLIINGQGVVGQRGLTFDSSTTPANSDDTYLLDRMLLLSDGNDIVDVSRETTTKPSGAYSCIKFDVETANKQFAYCQILEAKDAAKIIGGVASLSFKAKKGGSNATLEKLRAAIITWDSTADSVTSDVIATWAGAGTDPTLATNWTYENTPSDLTLTNSFQTFKIENVSIDTASGANVAVLIWCDDTDATVGDVCYIGDIQLEEGAIATPYEDQAISDTIIKCQRFYEKSYNIETVPGTITELGKISARCDGTNIDIEVPFVVFKRVAPTVTNWNPVTGTATYARNYSAGNNTLMGAFNASHRNYEIAKGGLSNQQKVGWHFTADAEL